MQDQIHPQLQLAVCDDEALDRAQIAQMAGEILRAEGIEAQIACFDGAAALRRCWRPFAAAGPLTYCCWT